LKSNVSVERLSVPEIRQKSIEKGANCTNNGIEIVEIYWGRLKELSFRHYQAIKHVYSGNPVTR
jgi:hypothetical protein